MSERTHPFHPRRALLAGVSCLALVAGTANAQSSDGAPVELPKVSVTDQATPRLSAETDGSGSYASPAATLMGGVATSLKEIPNSVSVITRQAMDDWNMTTLYDALSTATGVTAIPNDGTQAQYNSRGYGMNVMYNGMPSYNALSGSQQFDLAVYDRIEILRGTAGILMGTDPNPGGTVNLVTKKAKKQLAAKVTASYGTWSNARGMVDVTGPLNSDGSLRARLVASNQQREFFYDHADSSKKLLYGTLEYDFDEDTTVSFTSIMQRDRSSPFYGIPVYSNLTIPNTPRSFNPLAPWSKNETNTYEQSLMLERRLGAGWTAKASARWWKRDFRFNDGYVSSAINPANNTVSFTRRDSSFNYYRQNIDVHLAGPFNLFGRTHNAVAGYNREVYQTNNASGTLPALTNIPLFGLEGSRAWQYPVIPANSGGKSETFQEGFYGQLRVKLLDPLTLVGGARVASFTTKSRNIPPSAPTDWRQGAKRDGEIVPYGGLIYDLTKEIAAYVSLSQVFIPQTVTDVSGRTLDPRYGTQYEAGVKGAFLNGQLNASLGAFQIEDTNRAYADPANPGFYLQAGEVRSEGFDVEVSGQPLPGLNLTAGYSFLYTNYVKDATNQGRNFSNWYPRHTFKAMAVRRIEDGPLAGFSYGAGVRAVTSYSGNGSNSALKQNGYALFDAQVGYRFNDNFEVNLTGNNIFDQKYFSALGRATNTYNVYGDPANVMLTLTARY